MRKYLLIPIVLLLLIVVVGGGYMLFGLSRAPKVKFRTEPVSHGDLVATVGGTGTLEPEEVVDVGAQVAGKIVSFGTDADGKPIDFKSTVTKGMVLARVDDQVYKAQVDQSRSSLQSAKTKVSQAEANIIRARADVGQAKARANQTAADWERIKSLKTTGSISDTEYDSAKSAFEVNNAAVAVAEAVVVQMVEAKKDAESNVAVAQSDLAQKEANLSYCTILSEVDGTVIDRRVSVGQTIQSSFNSPSLFLIAKDLKKMQVWASVNEADIGRIQEGQTVTFTLDAYPNEVFKGIVTQKRLNATNTQNVVNYTVIISTENPSQDVLSVATKANPYKRSQDGKLLPYMTATLKFETDRHSNVLLVPNSALRYRPAKEIVIDDGQQPNKSDKEDKTKGERGVVYVPEGNMLRAIPVMTGLTDGMMTEILSGDIPDGTQLVVGEVREARQNTENPFAQKMGAGKKQ